MCWILWSLLWTMVVIALSMLCSMAHPLFFSEVRMLLSSEEQTRKHLLSERTNSDPLLRGHFLYFYLTKKSFFLFFHITRIHWVVVQWKEKTCTPNITRVFVGDLQPTNDSFLNSTTVWSHYRDYPVIAGVSDWSRVHIISTKPRFIQRYCVRFLIWYNLYFIPVIDYYNE